MNQIIYAVAGASLIALASMGWLLKGSYERNGKLEASLKTATERLVEINSALKEKDRVHGTNTALPDDVLFDNLLK